MNASMAALLPQADTCRRRSLALLAELQREVQQRKAVRGTAAAPDVDLSIAWAAMQVIDWLAWEATDRAVWPALVERFRLNIDPHTDQRAKLRALQEYVLQSCTAMQLLERIAYAGRARLPRRDGAAADGASPDADVERAGRDALAWLTQFTRECCAL